MQVEFIHIHIGKKLARKIAERKPDVDFPRIETADDFPDKPYGIRIRHAPRNYPEKNPMQYIKTQKKTP